MGITLEMVVIILFNFLSFAFFTGVVWTRLNYIEKKQEKYNELIVRTFDLEKEAEKVDDRVKDLEKD